MNNPPAFPCSTWHEEDGVQIGTAQSGMSLRDYFAATALPVLIGITSPADIQKYSAGQIREKVAFAAYAMADAMLAERNKEKK